MPTPGATRARCLLAIPGVALAAGPGNAAVRAPHPLPPGCAGSSSCNRRLTLSCAHPRPPVHCARSEEHTGCVNTLSWNESGSLLISGSDDCRVCVWDCGGGTPTLRRAVKTGHRRNIFSALFLPGTADQQVVTCALDRTVQHVDLMTGESTRLATCTQFCSKLALVPGCAHAFLSAGVDGRASLFDLREGQRTRRIAVDLNDVGGCTGLAFDPTSGGYHFALGCDDPITRVYDLRAVRFDRPDASRVLHQYVPRQCASAHRLKPIPSPSPYPHLPHTLTFPIPSPSPYPHKPIPSPAPYPHLPHTLTCPTHEPQGPTRRPTP